MKPCGAVTTQVHLRCMSTFRQVHVRRLNQGLAMNSALHLAFPVNEMWHPRWKCLDMCSFQARIRFHHVIEARLYLLSRFPAVTKMEENVFVGIIRAPRGTTAESLIRSLEVNGQAAERLGPTVLTFCISCTFLDLSKCDSSREHLRLMERI
jgi:hypothetical protein